MKGEKKIVITEEGIHVIGYECSELLASLTHALCEVFYKNEGPIDQLNAGTRIIDVLYDERQKKRIDIIYNMLTEEDEDGEEE